MMNKSFIIVSLFVSLLFASDKGYGTFISGSRGALLALNDISESDSVSLLQGVGYIEIKVPSKSGDYSNSLQVLPSGVSIDSISLKIEDGLSLKVYSVSLVADSLRLIKKNNKAMLLLETEPVEKYRYEFATDIAPLLEPKNPELNAIAQYGRDGFVFVELSGKDLSGSIVSMSSGRVFVDAKVTFMKKYLPLLSGYAARINKDGFHISYDTSKTQFAIKSVEDSVLVLSFIDKRELETPEITYWHSSKDKKVITLPEVVLESKNDEVVELPVDEDTRDKNNEKRDAEEVIFEAFQLYVIKDDINVRATASTNGEKVGTLAKGAVVTASGEDGEWYKVVMPDGDEAWVYKSLVKKKADLTEAETREFLNKNEEAADVSSPSVSDTLDLQRASEEIAVVEEKVVFLIKDMVNIRTVPKAGGRKTIIGAYKKGTRLISLEKKNNWSKVRLQNGKQGWVSSKFVLDSALVTAEMWDSFYNSGKAEDDLTVEVAQKDSLTSSDETFDISTKPNVFKISEEENSRVVANNPHVDSVTKKVEEKKEPEQLAIKYKKYGRDPFLPLNVRNLAKPSMPKVDDLSLVGVIYSNAPGAQNFALFEEKIKGNTTTFSLKEGEAIEDGKLLHIEENRVVFLMREADFTYTVEKIMENIDE